jgi:hypothetical protein
MIRTLIGILLLIAAIFWFPLWIQLVLFAVFIITDRTPFLAIIPAVMSDALYAPGSPFSATHHWMTLIVLVALALHYVIIRKLRVRSLYGVEA